MKINNYNSKQHMNKSKALKGNQVLFISLL